MSDTSSDISEYIDLEQKITVTWVDTYYFDCMPFNISNMKTGIIWRCEPVKPPYVDIYLEFQFVRMSELEFRITCIRTSVGRTSPNSGYKLRFYCSINVFGGEPKVFEMKSEEFIVFEKVFVEESYLHSLSADDLNKYIGLKILVKMYDYGSLSNELYFHQEDELSEMKEQFFNNESTLENMCFLLNIPRIQDIFTGRQNNEFAALKINFIKNTALISKKIAKHVRMLEEDCQSPALELGNHLNFILKGENCGESPIEDDDLIQLYFLAHHLGLRFLANLSRLQLGFRVGCNMNIVMDVMHAADNLNDEYIFYKAADIINYRESNMSEQEKWLKMLKDSIVESQFIVIGLKRLRDMGIHLYVNVNFEKPYFFED